VIDPADVQAVVPGITMEEATQAASLATLALQAAVWPNSLPDPLPPPMYQAGLSCAARIARSGDPSGQVVSESLGAYSYRVAGTVPSDVALYLTEAELELLQPWLGQQGVYDIDVSGAGAAPWSYEWFQRNLDNVLAALDAGELQPAGALPSYYLTEAEADARYSQLGHTHTRISQEPWDFSTNTADSDPGAGNLRLNDADPTLATMIYLDPIDAQGSDWGAILAEGGAGGVIRLQDLNDSTRWIAYDVVGAFGYVGAAAAVDYFRIPVSFASQSGTLALTNNMALLVYFAQPGHP
jgi:hypothetical protein